MRDLITIAVEIEQQQRNLDTLEGTKIYGHEYGADELLKLSISQTEAKLVSLKEEYRVAHKEASEKAGLPTYKPLY